MDNHLTELLNNEPKTLEQNSIAPGEVVIGQFLGFNSQGEPLVSYSTASSGTVAMSTVAITNEHTGRQIALLFANGDISKPVIMGLIHSPLMDILNNSENLMSDSSELSLEQNNSDIEVFTDSKKTNKSNTTDDSTSQNTALIDGNRVVLEGKEEIVLKCGEASITLTKAGKILIRGKYLLNRSSGVNRILGGSVQVN